jgi:predicted aconitase with swiveling domain
VDEQRESIVLRGRRVVGGVVEGEALVSKKGIELFFSLNRDTGMITEWKHPWRGQSIKGKILVFPFHRGSSGWGGTFIAAHARGNQPLAMIVRDSDLFVTNAAVSTGTPLVVELNADPCQVIRSGDWVKVDANSGVIEVYAKKAEPS